MKRTGNGIKQVMERNRLRGLALALAVTVAGLMTPRAEAGYYVSWTNEILRLAGQEPAHGTTWDVDAFTNLVDAVNAADGERVDYFINVPEETNTIEGAIAKGYGCRDVVVTGKSNVWTTIIIRTNTTPGSNGEYTNSAGYNSGYRVQWVPKRGMTFKGEPRTNVVLRGGFYPPTNDGNGFVLDGLYMKEGAYSFSGKHPRYITLYVPTEVSQIMTVKNCYFEPLSAGGAIYATLNNVTMGSYTIENCYFGANPEVFLSYGSNIVLRGNYFDGGSAELQVRLYRLKDSLFEKNTFANGAMVRGAGEPFAASVVYTNYVINNNFINPSETIITALSAHNHSDHVIVATNNWWGSINGPYDPLSESTGENESNTTEVDENSTDSENFRLHRNVTPTGEFNCQLVNTAGAAGTTNVMYVPWATSKLLVNEYTTEEEDETPMDVWVGTNYTDEGPGSSSFGGSAYMWGINAFTNIQEAVDRLTLGGTVWLAPETFMLSTQVVINGIVKIVGTQDVSVVSMTPGIASRCFYLNHESASLKDMVISNGYANGIGVEGQGGGVFVAISPQSSSSSFPSDRPVLDGCRVVDCRASDSGGGIALVDTTAKFGAYIRNTHVTGNVATNHGGGIASSNCLYLGSCLIDNNRALEGKGGGIYAAPDSQPLAGLGESVNSYRSWDYLAQGTVVSNNIAKGDGGGAYFTTHSWNLGLYTGAPGYRNYVVDHMIANWTFVGNRSREGSGGGAFSLCPPRGSGGGGSVDEGLFFYGCLFKDNVSADRGGGLFLETGRVDACTFVNNSATNAGGGIFIDSLQGIPTTYTNEFGEDPYPWMFIGMKGNPQPDGMTNSNYRIGALSRCTFDGNRSGNVGGGGIFATGTGFDSRSSVWGVSNLVNNVAANGSGGGILVADANLALQFMPGLQAASGNAASLFGGAICASNAVLTNCTFTGNQAGYGGALHLAKSTVRNSVITGNSATNEGGGVYLADGATLRNCLVSENSAARLGGGLYMAGSATNESSTVVMNTAPAGSGIAMEDGLVRNSILWLNDPSSTNWHVLGGTVEYSCAPPSGLPGDGNIAGSPRFMNAGRRDFRLAIGSAALDAGSNVAWMTTATDLIGASRIIDETVDMGAYEGAAGVGPQGAIFIVR